RRAIAVAALVMVPLGASALYLTFGSPSVPGQPLAARVAAETQSIQSIIARVEEHLAREPNDGRGWEVIAPVYLRLGRYDDAIRASRNPVAFPGETAERQAAVGGGRVTGGDRPGPRDARGAGEAS